MNNKSSYGTFKKYKKEKDVRLALDSELQQKAEEALKSQIKKTPDAKAGYAIVSDAKLAQF